MAWPQTGKKYYLNTFEHAFNVYEMPLQHS